MSPFGVTWISIHPPRGGGGTTPLQKHPCTTLFQSTHPVGGGTRRGLLSSICQKHFNPPTPWGVGPVFTLTATNTIYFNPPTPWGVGPSPSKDCTACKKFQSTHPVGGGTLDEYKIYQFREISIHPPRGGWDQRTAQSFPVVTYFNPPTPWGVGPFKVVKIPKAESKFQSTHPVGGGTIDQPL